MKATLEFNLDDQDDKMAHLRAVKAIDMACVLHEIRNSLRTAEKNDLDVDKLIGMIWENMSEINLDELI